MRIAWVLLALLGAAAGYLYFSPDGREQLHRLLPGAGVGPGSEYLYQWRNERGEWQITDTPPPAGTEYQRREYREDLNVLPVPPGVSRPES